MFKAQKMGLSTSIEEVEVERANEKSVWIRGSRKNRMSDIESYHLTFNAAKTHLLVVQEECIKHTQNLLAHQEKCLALILALQT